MKTCSLCDKKTYALNLCQPHYMKQYRRQQKSQECPRCEGQYELGRTVGRDQVANAITACLEEHGVECNVHTNMVYVLTPNGTFKKDIKDLEIY